MPSAPGCSPDWWDHALYFQKLPHSGHQLHDAQGAKQGAGFGCFFLVLQSVCLFYLFTACHPSPAGNTSLFIVLWCSEDVRCCNCLVADDRKFMLLMRQKRVVIFLAFEGKRDFPFSHMGKEQQVQDQSLGPFGSWCH